MTIHSAKGLEFPVVFLPGFEETIFPSAQSSFEQSELEEERRLAYVAVTRAKKELLITYCRTRLYFGRTVINPRSRFIDEIPAELCEIQSYFESTPMGSYSFGGGYSYSSPRTVSTSFSYQKQSSRPVSVSNPKPSVSLETFNTGDRVKHGKFGSGTVLSAKQMGADIMYEIAFDDFGTKKLMGTYAKLIKE
jgi:DNA helicase-2/ATP-dependent DNA helicase PcrA